MQVSRFFVLVIALLAALSATAETECPEFLVDIPDSDVDLFHKCSQKGRINESIGGIFSPKEEKPEPALSVYGASETAVASAPISGVRTEDLGQPNIQRLSGVGADPVFVEPKTAEEAIANGHNPEVIFNIREAFTVKYGPNVAQNSLFAQMAAYCNRGWSKIEEWVEPNGRDYYLHYKFQCAK